MGELKVIKKKHGGRDTSGRVAVRHQGGEHKRYFRFIDLRRDKVGVPGKVIAIEYDPNRTAEIALVQYADGEKRYILRPLGLNVNDTVISGSNVEAKVGNSMPLSQVPIGSIVHNVELTPDRGGQLARGAGAFATVTAREDNMVHLKLPSGEIRKVRADGFATIGQLGNIELKNRHLGKAGRVRHMGIRPTVRGVSQNPRSHPHGGGEGRSGVGQKRPKTYAGRPAVGKTRKKNKYSDKYIVQRRKR